uniref:Uncharacterized protein n=1 Tax=Octopus bimaculoides TaxID=37653 RepID=A0A0L8GUJ2_OCTBM
MFVRRDLLYSKYFLLSKYLLMYTQEMYILGGLSRFSSSRSCYLVWLLRCIGVELPCKREDSWGIFYENVTRGITLTLTNMSVLVLRFLSFLSCLPSPGVPF